MIDILMAVTSVASEKCDVIILFFFFQAEDGIRDFCLSRGLGDVYKRQCQDIQGYWVVECAELASMLRTDEKTVRDFITRPRDVFTPKYGRNGSIDVPRQCVFIGSTNDEQFLRDETGDRRYWPVEVTKMIDRAWVKAHRDEI